MDIRKDLNELGWALYKNNKTELIFEKHKKETLLIFNKNGTNVSFKNVHYLDKEELDAIIKILNDLCLREYFKRNKND
jgi:hypothetical protein